MPLTNSAIRLQVLVERVKAGEVDKIDALLKDADKVLRERLTRATVTAVQRDRIEALLVEVRKALATLYDRHSAAFLARMDELGEGIADTEARALAAALGGLDTATPTARAIHAAATTAPLGARGAGGGLLLETFVSRWAEADLDRVEGTIRRGFFEGRTTDQIIRDVRGTKAANYADGILDVNRRNARTVVHTAVQHVATQARVATLNANSDLIVRYRWISTLDSRTSDQCQALDQQEFELGEGPLPPAHPNCRSTIVPITKTFRELGLDLDEPEPGTRASVDGQVPGNISYFEWLKQQPADFVEEALGPTRADLFLRGGLSADEFARLGLSKNFQPLTIEQMREKAPLVFKRAGF